MGKAARLATIVTAQQTVKEQSNLYYLRSILLMLEVECVFSLNLDMAIEQVSDDNIHDVVFIDMVGVKWNEYIPANISALAKRNSIVLVNVKETAVSERSALLAGIKGVIYDTDTPDVQLKSIRSIIDGELWFRRSIISSTFSELLSEHLQTKNITPAAEIDETQYNLTKREKTIIKLIAEGAQNKEIANKLHISDHTVKTHLYSAFKKTKSRNRIELLNWARQFFPDALTRYHTN
ncbi:response regulator transcription factor [Pseudoalteromonas sp. MMG013]|uniref:helix-turn-helix transcriptional regulator n=1 Tax=unclassified Pseudoalteromonas TaxID=194690 RepID=UPI001B35C312|nr:MULTISPECIES: response regulator transcription factor [unclassified Pseudoalteromonas]MBQ4847558.1 response regulator transcription factor [Pseudoalteromonas sp. MMG005]MBQ4864515.1 response regulator transcription factor [Pseudoalteromonas sp. MMG013]